MNTPTNTPQKNTLNYVAIAFLALYSILIMLIMPTLVNEASRGRASFSSTGFWTFLFFAIDAGIVAYCIYSLVAKKKTAKNLLLISLLYIVVSVVCLVIGITLETSLHNGSSKIANIAANMVLSGQRVGPFNSLCVYWACAAYAFSSLYSIILWIIACILFAVKKKSDKKAAANK